MLLNTYIKQQAAHCTTAGIVKRYCNCAQNAQCVEILGSKHG